jgi:hypothetical protein
LGCFSSRFPVRHSEPAVQEIPKCSNKNEAARKQSIKFAGMHIAGFGFFCKFNPFL